MEQWQAGVMPHADRERCALTALRAAFCDDPVIDWLFAGQGGGAGATRLLEYFVRSSAAAEELAVTSDGAAAAVWLPCANGSGAAGEGADDSEVGTAGGEHAGPDDELPPELAAHAVRIATFKGLVGSSQPSQAHLYLAFIGVVPERRGAGRGGALLRQRLRRADEQGLPAYLEASSQRSRALYVRHGFADLGAPVRLPDGPTVWPMWRPSAPTADDVPHA